MDIQNWKALAWGTPVKFTELGESRFVNMDSSSPRKQKKYGIFLGVSRDGSLKVVREGSTTVGAWSRDFWTLQ